MRTRNRRERERVFKEIANPEREMETGKQKPGERRNSEKEGKSGI